MSLLLCLLSHSDPSFTAIHWYAMSAQDLMQYVENFHNELGGDIWITEYALQDFNGGPQGDEGQGE